MTYTLRLYLYLFVAGVVAVMGAVWLSPLGLTVNIILAVVVAYLGVVVGRWLFGRKNLYRTRAIDPSRKGTYSQ
jgi:uncharacterized membrane protein